MIHVKLIPHVDQNDQIIYRQYYSIYNNETNKYWKTLSIDDQVNTRTSHNCHITDRLFYPYTRLIIVQCTHIRQSIENVTFSSGSADHHVSLTFSIVTIDCYKDHSNKKKADDLLE